MPKSKLTIERPATEVWVELQRIEMWEGIGGLTDLRNANHDGDGRLRGFDFSLDTPLGTIRDRAHVTTNGQSMRVIAEAKGLEVSVHIEVRPAPADTTEADFAIEGRSTNLFTRVLAGTLQATLDSNIEREGARMAERLEPR